MRLPRYTATVHQVGEQRVLALVQLDPGGTSITNAAEGVVVDLGRRAGLRETDRVVYVDTEGRWDELLVAGGRFAGFRSLNADSLEQALERIGT